MSDAEKQDAIANLLEVQGFTAHALTARQIAGHIRDIESALARIGAMFEPDMGDEAVDIPCPECGAPSPLPHRNGCSVGEAFA